jgi:spermidine synthase
MRSWQTLDRIDSPDGPLELRRRGERDFLITLAGRVLMNSSSHRSEVALAELACAGLAGSQAPRVLIGGLGMGLTLRAALDALPAAATVVVAELSAGVVDWCRGPLAELTARAVDDARVDVVLRDVAAVIRSAAERGPRFDAILLDLYEGPATGAAGREDPFFGACALAAARSALTRGGVFGAWAERPDAGFEKRLRAAGFRVEKRRPGRGGLRHAIYAAQSPA